MTSYLDKPVTDDTFEEFYDAVAQRAFDTRVMFDFDIFCDGKGTVQSLTVPSINSTIVLFEVAERLLDIHPNSPFVMFWYFDGEDTQIALVSNAHGAGYDVTQIAKEYGSEDTDPTYARYSVRGLVAIEGSAFIIDIANHNCDERFIREDH